MDAVETNTFGANRLVLSEFDEEIATWAFDLNKESAQLAVEACSRVKGDRYVLGSMGPGTKLISLGQTTWDNMLDSYTEQARGLLEGGVDAFLIEIYALLGEFCAFKQSSALLCELYECLGEFCAF